MRILRSVNLTMITHLIVKYYNNWIFDKMISLIRTKRKFNLYIKIFTHPILYYHFYIIIYFWIANNAIIVNYYKYYYD